MLDIGLLYLFPLVFVILYLLVQLALQQRIGRARPFANKWSNLLYNLSFVAPFEWFVDKREDEEKKINRKISRAGLEGVLDARTQQTLQVSLFFVAIIIFILLMVAMEPLLNTLFFLVGMEGKVGENGGNAMVIIRLGTLLLTMALPVSLTVVMSRKIKQREMALFKDLPMLQMFITLMLRSDATIEEMLYTLTTTETAYQSLFQVAYRKFVRNQSDAFQFLYEAFAGTPIIETLQMLERFNDYAKVDTILAIENNQEQVILDTAEAKRKVNQFKNVTAAISFALPFLALGFLGLGPILYFVLEAMNNAL